MDKKNVNDNNGKTTFVETSSTSIQYWSKKSLNPLNLFRKKKDDVKTTSNNNDSTTFGIEPVIVPIRRETTIEPSSSISSTNLKSKIQVFEEKEEYL